LSSPELSSSGLVIPRAIISSSGLVIPRAIINKSDQLTSYQVCLTQIQISAEVFP
jgi:hypothetical protein